MSNLKFLEGRLALIKTKLMANPDYVEMTVLERIIKEESHQEVPTVSYSKPSKKKRKYSKKNNPPAYSQNGKMTFIYDSVANIVSKNGGRMTIDEVKSRLKAEHTLSRSDLKNVVSYIYHINKRSGQNQRVFLWPTKPEPGNKRVLYRDILTSVPKTEAVSG